MKLIFLDIDGVLNSDSYMKTDEYKNEVYDCGVTDYKSYDVVLKAHHTHLDPKAILLINQLVDQTDAKIVLSSSWRFRYSTDEMNAMLEKRGATFKLIGATPKISLFGSKRGDEVAEFLSKLEEQPESFVIIDDIDQFPKLRKHFVCCPEYTGFKPKQLYKALRILNG